MSEHVATVAWKRESESFDYKSYNRDHTWSFDGDMQVRASAAPAYRGNPALVDPEEALVASLSSCHMLTFLALASQKGFVVDSYTDRAVGHLEKNSKGKLAITRVDLYPNIAFAGSNKPTSEQLAELHDRSHHECFIANSVLTEVQVKS